MACRITFTDPGRKREQAFTLVEVMVASALALTLSTALVGLSFFTSRSFVAMANYTDLALYSRMAMDKMARDIRQQRVLTAYATNAISLQDTSGNTLRYLYDSNARTVVCVTGTQTNIYLYGCDSLQFWLYQHTIISNTFDCYTPAYLSNARLVQVTWTCSRKVMQAKVNTEVTESSKIALRNH